MKKIAITIIKFIGFFLGWAILTSILPLSSSEEPAIWRLWAEIMPLLAIIAFTLIFWLIERKNVELHLFDNSVKGMVLGIITGIVWLAVPVLVMYIAKIIHFEGINSIKLFPVWLLAAFLNVIMQELLVRGYLYQMIKQKHNIVAATIVTTALFTALHGGAFEAGVVPVLNVLTMSLLMTVVLEYSGSIIAPTIMHFLWNGTGALVLGGVSLAEDYPSIKTVTDFRGTGDYTNYAFTAEFSIKEGSDIVDSEELAENWYYGFIYVSFSVFLQSNEYKNRRNEGGKHHENSKPEINQRSGKRKQRGFWKTDHHASGIPIQTGVYVYEE